MAEMAAFKQKTVLVIMQQFFKDEKSKRTLQMDFWDTINPEGLALLSEVLRIFVSEAANRAAVQADKDGSDEVTVEQVEKILPELLLDL